MSELNFILLTKVLTQNLNIVDLIKFLKKNKKTSHLDCSDQIEGDTMQNHEPKKSGKPKFYGQNKLGHMATCKALLKTQEK
jgi:hypothetical protein